VEWCEASARAGAVEKMISRRLRESLIRGDLVTARMMASAHKDAVAVLKELEPEALKFYRDGQPWLEDVDLKTIYSEGGA
jgi:hypothetical protein